MLAAQAILPIFALIVLGYLLGWRQWLTSESAAGLANITFKLFMPTLLFAGIAKASLAEGLSPMLLLAYLAYVVLAFDVPGLLQKARMENAAILLSDFWSHKVHITRDNRTGTVVSAIEGEARSSACSASVGSVPSAMTPRIAPRSRRCRRSRIFGCGRATPPASAGRPRFWAIRWRACPPKCA